MRAGVTGTPGSNRARGSRSPRSLGLQRAASLCLLLVAASLGCGGAANQERRVEAPAPARGGDSAPEGPPPARRAGPSLSPAAAKLYDAGMQAFEKADLRGAEQQFSRALSLDRKAYPAHLGLGIVQERRGELAKALESYAAALAIVPDYGPALAAKVRLLLGMGRSPEAESFARAAAGKFPDSAAALGALAEVMSARGDSAGAQQTAQKALKKDPDYRPAMVTLARDHYRARRLDLALYTLTAILDGYGQENPPRDKNNADARLLRAQIYKERGKRKLAMDELAAVLALRPDLVTARLQLAAYMLEAGNAAEARPLLEKALEYDPSNVLVHLNLGDAYRLLGKPQDALDHLNWVSRKDDTLAQAHYNLGLVYLLSAEVPGVTEKQAIERAIEEFERFKRLEPRAARGAGDDVDDLIARARNKKAILEALEAQPEAPAAEEATGDQG